MDILKSIFLAAGGLAALIGTAAWLAQLWVRHWLENRQLAAENRYQEQIEALRHQQNEAIEQLRATLRNRRELFSTAVSTGSAMGRVAQRRRIEAVEAIWNEFLELRGETYWWHIGLQSNFAMHTDAEGWQDVARSHRKVAEKFGGWDKHREWINDKQDRVEMHRPFIGERLWGLFWVYCRFLQTSTLHTDENVTKSTTGPSVLPWYEPGDGVAWHFRLLTTYVPNIDAQALMSRRDRGFRAALDILEREMVQEIQILLTGAASTRRHIVAGRRLAEHFADIVADPEVGPNRHPS